MLVKRQKEISVVFCYNVITVRIRLLILHVFCMQDIIRLLISQLKRTMHEYINL